MLPAHAEASASSSERATRYWTAQQSQIYPELARLTAAGLIEHEADDGPGPRQRKTHRITPAGREALASWLAQPPAPRAPRDEAVLKTYALAEADPVQMWEFYLREAARHEQRLTEYEQQQAELLARGADDPAHPDFGAYATLQLGLLAGPARARWCRWLADQMAVRARTATAPGPTVGPDPPRGKRQG